MKYKCSCGFEYCTDDGTATYCGSYACEEHHYVMHENWSSNQVYKPTGSIFSGKPKWCPSCEDRVNVTDHICKSQDKAKDTIDIMIDIYRKDKKDG